MSSIASGKPLSPSTQQIRMSLDAALLEIGEHLHPELGALGLLEPQAQDVAVALERDPQGPGSTRGAGPLPPSRILSTSASRKITG